jgi:pyridoxine/pyridoxamine 5'-phosphate oxidase
MKEVIEKALSRMCMNSRFAINSESGRSHIAEHLLKTFRDNHIVFYTNLEEARKAGLDKKDDQIDLPFERGL